MGEIEFYQNFNHKKGTQLCLKINLCSLRWINLQYRYLVDYRYASPVVHCVFSDCCCVLLFSGGLLDASGDLEDGEIPSADSRLKTSAVISAVDSPASPDISAMVTGSPVKIIPASPPRKDEESGSALHEPKEKPRSGRGFLLGGQSRTWTGDPTIFSRLLYQLSYLAVLPIGESLGGPDGIWTRDLLRDRQIC